MATGFVVVVAAALACSPARARLGRPAAVRGGCRAAAVACAPGDDAERARRARAPPLPPDGLPPPPLLTPGEPSEGRAPAERALIRFYKEWISPVLPRACRFQPTCSSYGLQAYEQFGARRGTVLTAWRIARCNPLGGSGFDPPRWPPPAWGAGSTSWWRGTPLWRDADGADDERISR